MASESKNALPLMAGIALFVGASVFAAANLFGAFQSAPDSAGAPAHGKGHGPNAPGKEEKPVPVRTVVVEEGDLTAESHIPGEVLSSRRADLRAKSSGTLLRLKKRLGDTVRAGELIGWLDPGTLPAEVKRAEAMVAVAAARVARIVVDVERLQKDVTRKIRLEGEGVTSRNEREKLEHELNLARADVDIANAEVARADADLEILRVRLEETRIVAPFAGRVGRTLVDEGSAVTAGQAVLQVLADDAPYVQFAVRATERRAILVGTPVDVTAGDRVLRGEISRVGVEIEAASRTVLVEARVSLDGGTLMPGMFVDVRVPLGATEQALVVPDGALVGRGPVRTVFVVEDDKVRAVETRVLLESRDRAAVVGPEKGARVVVDGRDQMKDGAKVEVVP